MKIWIVSGIPGSGKSTWIKEKMKTDKGIHISRDAIRFSLIKEDEEYFSHEDEVLKQFYKEIKEATSNSEIENVFIDATHLSPKVRANTLQHIKKTGAEIICVEFNISSQEAIKRNNNRTGREKVPASVIRRMDLTKVEPTFKEGFDTIVKVLENGNEIYKELKGG